MEGFSLPAGLGNVQLLQVGTTTSTTNTLQQAPQQGNALLSGLPSGVMLRGFVINRDGNGNPVLRTERGDIAIKSDVFLKTGSEIELRVNTQANHSSAKIVTVDSLPLKDYAMQQATRFITVDTVRVSANSLPQTDILSANEPSTPPAAANNTTSKAASASGSAMSLSTANNAMPQPTLSATLLMPSLYGTPEQTQAMLSSILQVPQTQLPMLQKDSLMQLRVLQWLPPEPAATMITATNTPIKPDTLSALTSNAATSATTVTAPTTNAAATDSATLTANSALSQPADSTPPPLQRIADIPLSNRLATESNVMKQTAANPSTSAAGAASSATTSPPVEAPSAMTSATTSAMDRQIMQAAMTSASKTGTLTATVIGHEPDGAAIVRTAIGSIRLHTQTPPPTGMRLIMEWVPTPQTYSSTSQAGQQPPGFTSGLMPQTSALPVTATTTDPVNAAGAFGHEWPALEESLELLKQYAPQQAARFAQRIPNTQSELVNSVLFFISAVKGGDIRRWLSQPVAQSLEENAPSLLARLSGDALSMVRVQTADAPDQNWHMFLFPLTHKEETTQARLYVRGDEEQDPSGDRQGVRFVMELSLSRLGEIQLDGWVHTFSGAKQFDLILRSPKPMSTQFEAESTALFEEALRAIHYRGGLSFEHGFAQFVKPLQDIGGKPCRDIGSIIV